jgi:hypothetical protein
VGRPTSDATDVDRACKLRLPRVGDVVLTHLAKAVEKRYPGLDRVICATPLGTPLDVQLEDLDRFAKEVIPAFRHTRTAAAAQ